MNNIDKIMQYIQVLAKEPVEVDGKMYDRCRTIKKIQLSDTFFNVDGCTMCGCCDIVDEDNVYVQFEYDKIMSIEEPEFHSYNKDLDINELHRLREGIVKESHTVNGKEVPLYVFKKQTNVVFVPRKGKEVRSCTWLTTLDGEHFFCNIHPVTSITCKMPHLKFRYSSASPTLSIGIFQYGRNWALKCPIILREPQSEGEWKYAYDNRKYKLEYLNRVADELGVETYLPDILSYLDTITYENYRSKLRVNIVNLDESYHPAKRLF